MNPLQFILLLLVRVYQWTLSPLLAAVFAPLGLGCRFQPTCSHYAAEAIRRHGAFKGAWLTLRRLARCQPWGGCGHDPVPEVSSPGRRRSAAPRCACPH